MNIKTLKDGSIEAEDLRLLYQVTVSDLSYFKTQQWNVTYYTFLVDAALVGIAQALGQGLAREDRWILGSLAILAAGAALFVLRKLQRSISVRQSRLDAVRQGFSEAFNRAWSVERKEEDSVQSILLLRGGLALTAALTIWLVGFRLGAA